MAKQSAGLLIFRRGVTGIEVLLIHPGGPFWSRKDDGAWTIPKGGIQPGETVLDAARREFFEETGIAIPEGVLMPLKPIKQAAGKIVHAWALETDLDLTDFHSNTFTLIWPPKSDRTREFPEADKAQWFTLADARRKILKAQVALLDQVAALPTA